MENKKEKIIERAISLLEEKQPALHLDYNDYEISVWKNSVTELVKFRRLFRIFSGIDNDAFTRIFDITVNLSSNEILPFDQQLAKDNFHHLEEHEKEILSFVKANTNLPYAIKRNYQYEIFDVDGYYDIYIRMNGSFTNYRLDKITGEQSGFNELNANPAQAPAIDTGETDPLIELH